VKFDLATDSISLPSTGDGAYQIEVRGYRDSTYTLHVAMPAAIVASAPRAAGAAKPQPAAPIVAPASAPDNHQALPAAPMTADLPWT